MVEYQRTLLMGTYRPYDSSGLAADYRPVAVCSSGELQICSGLNVFVESGVGVLISGQHVYVESGVHVIADVEVEVSSGLWVDGVSGVHVYQESGAFVTTQPNIGISGTVTVESGLGVLISGQHVYQESGAFVTTQPNIGISGTVTVESGLHVWVSGQHTYQESGAFVITQPNIGVSGTVNVASGAYGTKETACATIGRTGQLVKIVGGSSGTYVAASSGGISICVSGYWCSGPVHTLTVKNLSGNDDVFVGFSNCPPYSGWGYLLVGNEDRTYDLCNPCNIYIVGNISGQMICWDGTDY